MGITKCLCNQRHDQSFSLCWTSSLRNVFWFHQHFSHYEICPSLFSENTLLDHRTVYPALFTQPSNCLWYIKYKIQKNLLFSQEHKLPNYRKSWMLWARFSVDTVCWRCTQTTMKGEGLGCCIRLAELLRSDVKYIWLFYCDISYTSRQIYFSKQLNHHHCPIMCVFIHYNYC